MNAFQGRSFDLDPHWTGISWMEGNSTEMSKSKSMIPQIDDGV